MPFGNRPKHNGEDPLKPKLRLLLDASREGLQRLIGVLDAHGAPLDSEEPPEAELAHLRELIRRPSQT